MSLLIVVSGTFIFILLLGKFSASVSRKFHADFLNLEAEFNELSLRKKDLLSQRDHLEKQFESIRALYAMTEELTQNINRQEAFYIMKSNLRDNMYLDDYQWTDVLAPEVIQEDKEEESCIIELGAKPENKGFLVFRKISPEARKKIKILGEQLALAMKRFDLSDELEKISITDSLTGLYSRRYFSERFEEELMRAKLKKIHLSFAMIDVDHFKKFNDQYGHLTGDGVLKEIGALIKATIREIDIAGRFGGEEFCVVLPDTDRVGALLAAERIRSAVEKKIIKAKDTIIKTTVSIGVATFPTHATKSDDLMDKADWALYRAKKNGRNAICAFGLYTI